MPHFVQTTTGSYINADDIERIIPAAKDQSGSRIMLRTREGRDSVNYEVWESATDLAERVGYQYVSAQPGYAVVRRYDPATMPDWTLEDFKRWQTPVLAWRFSADENWPTPITVDGPWDDGSSDTHLIIHPSGTVVQIGERSWPSLDEAYTSLKDPGSG